ncbi:hypothetical protein ACQ86N_48340 [Puia sp. P3]|uniref:hypothetical protein n=1 Tax=Puia sp. P3 TaxID=3423952 RepID=UPI003D668D7E
MTWLLFREPVVLFILEGRGKIEEVEGACQAFYRIVQVCRCFCVLTDDQVVELTGGFVAEDRADEEGGRATLQVPAGDPLGIGHK